ncbi:hypothetical protein EDB84DRAFT_1269003 [Lactarius hengduanensis]|nr:hypothetical protein EDB84DRAFT_1269003 [Lactarius hengduanensis]
MSGLTEFKHNASVHGLLAGISFLVVLPAGVLIARYTRTFTNRWFHAHWIVNFLVGCPLILAAWVLGKKAHNFGHASLTPHGKRGLFVIGLYIAQLVLGLVIHYIHIPFPSLGHRPPQNFFHAVQGLVVLGLANYQVYDGIYHKTGFLAADARQSAKHAWLALLIIFWALYAFGLILLRRQYTQERRARLQKNQETFKMRSANDSYSQDKLSVP